MTKKPVANAASDAILIVDDEEAICWSLRRALERRGKTVFTAGSAEVGVRLAEQERPSVILMDIRLPGMDGLAALERLRGRGPWRIIMMTAFGDLTTAVRALNGGAFDYLLKPFDLDQALAVVDRALAAEASEKATKPPSAAPTEELVGRTPAMQEVFRRVALVAGRSTCVLITGESGTGKELVARAIHQHGPRRDRPFVPIHMATLNAQRLEAELFGSVLGSDTTPGLLAAAGDGTVLLDEVGDLPPDTQAKLLRVLEQGEYWPVGGSTPLPLKARVIAVSQRDLEALVAEGRFRADLWFRLNTFPIRLPPLRERLDDIPLLAEHFLSRLDPRLFPLPADTLSALQQHPWPGNVRELRNVLEHAVIVARGGPLRPEHLPQATPAHDLALAVPQAVRRWVEQRFKAAGVPADMYAALLREVEPALLTEVMRQAKGNRWRAAKWLGLTRTTLRKKLAQHGLTDAFRALEPAGDVP